MSTVLSRNVMLCTTVFKQGTGLMFTKQQDDFAYVFPFSKPRKLTITMWFVFYPIDILFLDEHGVVIEIVSGLKPFQHYFASKHAVCFIELPKNTITKHSISLGNRIHYSSNVVKLA